MPNAGLPGAMRLREMTLADVAAGLRLCRLSQWNQLARDWEQFLRLEPGGAVVAQDETGQVIGSVATLRYASAPAADRTLGWIAMVLVDPVARGRGVGTALLDTALARAADVTTVGLDATPLGQPLYEKLGFVTDARLTRMERAAHAPAAAGFADAAGASPVAEVRPATGADLDAMAALDAAATGLDRRAMLAWLLEGAPEFAFVHGQGRDVDGFMLGRQGHAFSHLGPVIGSSLDAVSALLRACLSRHAGRLILDVAEAQPGARAVLAQAGFTAQRPFARMYRGGWRPGGDESLLFASIGPEFG